MKTMFSALCLMLVTYSAYPALAVGNDEQAMPALFGQLDRDGDGYLSRDEVYKTAPELTRWLSVSRFGGFELADVNRDGQLDLAEFAAYEEEIPAE